MPIAVACPKCGFRGQAPDQAAGKNIKCRKCGTLFPVSLNVGLTVEEPGPTNQQPTPAAKTGPGKGCIAGIVVGCSGLFVVVAGLAMVGFLYFRSQNAEPATARELVERLQSRGMQILWDNAKGARPSIYIVRKDYQHMSDLDLGPELDNMKRQRLPIEQCVILVVQYETAEQAAETAGSRPDAFAYGRFMIESNDDDFLNEVRQKLRWP